MGKTATGIVFGILAGIVVIIIGVVLTGYFFGPPLFKQNSPGSGSFIPSPAIADNTTAPTWVSPPTTPAVTATPSIPQSSATGSVNFNVNVTGVSGSGLSRTITTQISNTGSADSHNVWVKVEAFSGNSKIKISGQDYLRVDIGTLKASGSTTKQTSISFSTFDALTVAQNGARFLLTIYSDERSQSLTYDYKP